MSARNGQRPATGFVHEGIIYRDEDEYLSTLLPFLRTGLAADEPVLVAVPPARIELLRSGLGSDRNDVRFVNMTEAGRNPTAILPVVLHNFVAQHPGRRPHIVGEPIWAGRSAEAYRTAVQHEALINLAFADRDAAIVCPYDAAALDETALQDAHRTHPIMVDREGRRQSLSYADPAELAAGCLQEPPHPPEAAWMTVTGEGDLARMRRFVAAHALQAGLDAHRTEDFQLAVNELAANALAHTGGPAVVRVWREQRAVVGEVSDEGTGAGPLMGREPPEGRTARGRGLLLVNQLCDLVQIDPRPTGTTIRIHTAIG